MTKKSANNFTFKPRARMLLLLGDQLIRDPGIAIFELVKNAYDADSSSARVTMSQIDNTKKGKITVKDSGTGMDYQTVVGVWMEPGTDYRAKQRQIGERTQKYRRLPIGEKGVGRFAAHKLGDYIRLVTRKKNNLEIVVEIDWTDFDEHEYLEDITISIVQREPEIFTGDKTGTRIDITGLRNSWNRGLVRELARSMNAICSPFAKLKRGNARNSQRYRSRKRGEFKTKLVVKNHPEWLKGLLTVNHLIENSLYRAHCDIDEKELSFDYQFQPYDSMTMLTPRSITRKSLSLTPPMTSEDKIDLNLIEQYIGKIHIDLYIYDLEPKILALGVSDRKGLRAFLKENGGIRVYREDIRVYDYGEPGNDWLNLGALRINVPAARISNNLVLGAISIDFVENSIFDRQGKFGLIEKTNREGFVDNPTFRAFKHVVSQTIQHITTERNIDKVRIRNAYSSKKMKEPVVEDLSELRELIDKRGLIEELGPYLERIEKDFVTIRDRFLTSSSAGLSLAVVIHEVEKGVAELEKAVKHENSSKKLIDLAKHLAELVEGFGSLMRRSGATKEKASELIKQAIFNTQFRLKIHNIEIIPDTTNEDFSVKCSRRLTISSIMNLIDNSIWWLDNKYGDSKKKKKIYVGIDLGLTTGPAIVIADNGPGFIDPPEYLVEPFLSRKPDGMGLGLHIADEVMRAQAGELLFPDINDVSVSKYLTGAIVALSFHEGK